MRGFRIPLRFVLLVFSVFATGCSREPDAPAAPADSDVVVRLAPALEAIVPEDAIIEKLAGDFQFIEGPVWIEDAAGGPHLLFSDIRANTIYSWSPTEGVSEFLNPVTPDDSEAGGHGGSNGLSLDLEGRLILCEHGNRQVSRIETDNSRSVLADRFEGKRLNSPNDILFHSSGWAYFTDPPYGLTDGDEDPQKELDHNGIYRLGPEGQLELLREQTRPNGLALSPDEKTLYVANSDSEQRVWFAYDVLEDGRLSEGKIFFDATESDAPGVPDGLRVDTSGNVYATGPGGVWIFAPDGTHLGTIHPPELPANVGWGDEDGKTLYITARTGLYRIRLMIYLGPRIVQVMGEDVPLLRSLSYKSAGGIPTYAMLVQSALTLGFIYTATFQQVLLYAGFTLNLITALTVAGVFVLRHREPEIERPYRTWGYP